MNDRFVSCNRYTEITRVVNGIGPIYTRVKLQVLQEQGYIPQNAFLGGLVMLQPNYFLDCEILDFSG